MEKRTFYFVLLIIITGHLICLFLKKDVFPFSNYPMYSKKVNIDKTFRTFHFKAEFENGESAEIVPKKYFPLFNTIQLTEALGLHSTSAVPYDKIQARKRLNDFKNLVNKRSHSNIRRLSSEVHTVDSTEPYNKVINITTLVSTDEE